MNHNRGLAKSRAHVHKPAPLRRGGRIGVVAPAGYVSSGDLAAGIEAIRNEGFEVEVGRGVNDRKGYLAGSHEIRARDLRAFFLRDDIDAIFCARGGFGSIQLLPSLDAEIHRHPKIFCGYSDITILLNWFLQKFGLVTFHAPMVAMDLARGLSEQAKEHFWGILTGEKQNWRVNLAEALRPGKCEAPMIGGCLSLLVTTLGTPFEIDTRGKILFVEDIGEKPYRIERMLMHLRLAGKLDGLAGVVFGDFPECGGEGPRDVKSVISEMFNDAPYPVVTGMAAGHGAENLALPLGVRMLLDADAVTLSLLESPVK
ncbi:MAG: LD-carboxypeptidase [Deltaproteobacteria bacterium]|nr:LD-carboxypeptidase [Deltaproteobacteria bacterium]